MKAIQAYLQQLDGTWKHPFESLASALEGVGEEEAAWQAPCYADCAPEDGWPQPGTIRWHVAHLAYYKDLYARIVSGRGKEPTPASPARVPTRSFADDLAALSAAHAAQREAIAACSDEDLTLRLEDGRELGDFLAATLRHDTWHAAQIVVARRLWNARGLASP